MNLKFMRLPLKIALLYCFIQAAIADTIVLYPDADTYISSAQPNSNFGSNTTLMVGKMSTREQYHTFLHFNGIPTGVRIQSAYLSLKLTTNINDSPPLLDVKSSSLAWSENNLTWNNAGSANCWNKPNPYSHSYASSWGILRYDVTENVTEWANEVHDNLGFHISLVGIAAEKLTFASRESKYHDNPQLAISYTPLPDVLMDDAYEKNDTMATAYDVSANKCSWFSKVKGLGVQWNDDWYRVSVASGYQHVMIDCQFTHEFGDIDVVLLDTTGKMLASSTSTSDNEYIDCTVASAGTYYFKVFGQNNGNTYDLWWGAATGTRRSLLVGINNYDPKYVGNSLPTCVNDAEGMRYALRGDRADRWRADNIRILTDNLASKNAIRAEFQNLAAQSVAGDIVVYFHSSHGGRHSGTDTFICSYNANYEDEELGADLTLFNPSVKVIVIVDACYSGGLFKDVEWPFARNVMEKYRSIKTQDYRLKAMAVPEDLGSNIAFVTACNYDETCLAGARFSLYTKYLLDSCATTLSDTNKDGDIQFLEAYTYAKSHAHSEYAGQNAQSLNDSLLAGIAFRTHDTFPDDFYEKNNTMATAYSLPRGNWLSAVHGFGVLYDVDYYRISVTPGLEHILIGCPFINAIGPIDRFFFELYDASGKLLATGQHPWSYEHNYIDYTAPACGTYYVHVLWGADGNKYDLRWDADTPQPQHLYILSSPIPVPISVSPKDNNNADNGATPLSRYYNYGTAVTLTAPANYQGLFLSKWTGDATSSGTSILVTTNAEKRITAQYRDAWDTGDDTSKTLTTLTPPKEIEQTHGPHSLTDADQKDWFKIYLTARCKVNFNIDCSIGDVYLAIINPVNGAWLATGFSHGSWNEECSVDYTPPVSGYYLVYISRWNYASNCYYTLKYRSLTRNSIDPDRWCLYR